tara:strand:- start:322 stop:603 length:282 start_codon:yes stop_codon:yes gene_type:complete
MKKAFLFIFYFSLFCTILIVFGHVVLSVADSRFKGAICHQIDKEECERRYDAYRFCVATLKEEKQLEEEVAKEFCFKTSFFGVSPYRDKDEHN